MKKKNIKKKKKKNNKKINMNNFLKTALLFALLISGGPPDWRNNASTVEEHLLDDLQSRSISKEVKTATSLEVQQGTSLHLKVHHCLVTGRTFYLSGKLRNKRTRTINRS